MNRITGWSVFLSKALVIALPCWFPWSIAGYWCNPFNWRYREKAQRSGSWLYDDMSQRETIVSIMAMLGLVNVCMNMICIPSLLHNIIQIYFAVFTLIHDILGSECFKSIDPCYVHAAIPVFLVIIWNSILVSGKKERKTKEMFPSFLFFFWSEQNK